MHLDFDLGGIQAAVGEALAEAFAGRGARSLAGQRVEQPLHRCFLSAGANRLAAAFALQPDRFLDQVAGDLLDVAADIADLGELGRLDLHEGGIGELRQTAADLGLSAAGRPDHQDVLGRDLVAQLRRKLLAAPAVAQGHGDGALRVVLADDMVVQSGDDRLGSKLVLQHFGCPAALGNGGLVVHPR